MAPERRNRLLPLLTPSTAESRPSWPIGYTFCDLRQDRNGHKMQGKAGGLSGTLQWTKPTSQTSDGPPVDPSRLPRRPWRCRHSHGAATAPARAPKRQQQDQQRDDVQLVKSSTTSMSACSTRATRTRTHVSTCIPVADQRPRAALLAQRAVPRLRAAIEASRWPQTRSLRSWVWGAAPSRHGIYPYVKGDSRCHRTGAPCRGGPRGCCALRGRAGAAGLSAYACLAAQQVSDGSHVLQGPAPDYGRREWADSGGKHLGSAHGEPRVEKCRGGPGRA